MLTKGDQPWVWGEAHDKAFQELKDKLSTAPILRRPIRGRPFQLHTDWSMLGLGAVLTQSDDEGKEFVVAFASRSNNAVEAKYGSYEGECLAAVWVVAHFRCYLFGNPFTLITDHQPLKWLMENDKLTGKLARWALILQEYEFTMVHRACQLNQDADGLSRNPCTSQQDLTGARWRGEDQEVVPGWHASAYLCMLIEEDGVDFIPISGQDCTACAVITRGGVKVSQSLNVQPDAADPESSEDLTRGRDIYNDVSVVEYLRSGTLADTIGAKERDRILQRAKRFKWEGSHMLRLLKDGQVRLVPHPSERTRLVRHAHEELGHFGVKRTHSLFQGQYWWHGMQTDVKQFVAKCMVCNRVRASFNAPTPQLHPLPIMGLGYRWSLDFAGPLPVTSRHNRYMLVMVEHFSKWIELVALPDKSSEGVAYSFLNRVLSHFGAPTEVLTDQGTEFLGDFQDLLNKCLIDHRTTSRDHPQADGLAERIVQTVKRALRKYGLQIGHVSEWDLQLPWLAMGYRFNKQASLASFSPYMLLFGREPELPAAIRRKVSGVVQFDNLDLWFQVCSERAELFRRVMPMAFQNLSIAQHHDKLMYATIRGGGYRPSIRRFSPGDFVYLQQVAHTTLDVVAGRTILRVREVLPSRVLLLEGCDGMVWKDHVRNCAPCHLPNIDGTVDPTVAVVPAGLKCMLCGLASGAATMLVCNSCSRGWHMSCLRPLVEHIPDGQWFCPRCKQQ